MTTSDQFELGKCIGQGTYGAVYELIGHEPPAVMKYMPCGNAEQLKIFKNECEALIKIHHGNIVRLYRHVEEKDRVGIVMEYCQKGPLKGVLLDPNITYSMNTVLTWGIQLFDAIDHMYQKHKLVHRDIKPDNIFLTNEYQLKIGDFGLVKAVGDETVAGTCMGTPRYMSPPDMKDDGVRNVYEQMRDIKDSHRNDVYSLGLVMWEIMERRTIFTNYERSGMFDRDQLLFDIALKRLTEIEPPECQSEIQKIISRCTNFQRIHRPAASEVLDFLNQTQKTNEFISSLPFMPTEDENQKELMKPIGFDDKKEWVMVESEERKFEKRFVGEPWQLILDEWAKNTMRDKLETLNSAEREKFFKEAPNIVSRLKEETQTFKDARYVIEEILKIESEKENLHEKNIYEIFELFVLGDFNTQSRKENDVFGILKSHEVIWISSFYNWDICAYRVDSLKDLKREKYTTNFYFRCFISQLTGEGWIHIGWDEFVNEDFRLWKQIPGRWVDNPRAEIWSYEIENEDEKHELLHFSHYKQITPGRIIDAFEKQQKRMETIIKLHLKHLVPIKDSENNNVPFNIESLLDESSEFIQRFKRFYLYTFPHYIFQLRNPPRPICQKKHSGKCQMDGFRKMEESLSDLPKELHIPVCGEITVKEVLFLESYMVCIGSNPSGSNPFGFMKDPFLFLCCQNLLEIPFLVLLDHPNNYENGESILGLDLKMKLHHMDVAVLREYFQESKLNERVYALIKSDWGTPYIRLIDYQGKPETEWLEFNELKTERKRKDVSCSVS